MLPAKAGLTALPFSLDGASLESPRGGPMGGVLALPGPEPRWGSGGGVAVLNEEGDRVSAQGSSRAEVPT